MYVFWFHLYLFREPDLFTVAFCSCSSLDRSLSFPRGQIVSASSKIRKFSRLHLMDSTLRFSVVSTGYDTSTRLWSSTGSLLSTFWLRESSRLDPLIHLCPLARSNSLFLLLPFQILLHHLLPLPTLPQNPNLPPSPCRPLSLSLSTLSSILLPPNPSSASEQRTGWSGFPPRRRLELPFEGLRVRRIVRRG